MVILELLAVDCIMLQANGIKHNAFRHELTLLPEKEQEINALACPPPLVQEQ